MHDCNQTKAVSILGIILVSLLLFIVVAANMPDKDKANLKCIKVATKSHESVKVEICGVHRND